MNNHGRRLFSLILSLAMLFANFSSFMPVYADENDPDSGNMSFFRSDIGIRYNSTRLIMDFLRFSSYVPDEYSLLITSDNPDVIEVDGPNLIAKDSGTCTITVENTDGEKVQAEFEVGDYADAIDFEEYSAGNYTVKSGNSVSPSYRTYPEDALCSDEEFTWESENTDLATVDQNGLVKTHNPGYVNVNATSKSGHKLSFGVSIYSLPDLISVNESRKGIKIDYSRDARSFIYFEPSTANDCPLTVTSSNENAITVQENELYAVGNGWSTITVSAENGVNASFDVYAGRLANGINVVGDQNVSLDVNGQYQLSYQLWADDNEYSDEIVEWTVESGTDVVSVDSYGMVTALKSGYATVRATIFSGEYVTYDINVRAALSSLWFNSAEYNLLPGQSMNIRDCLNWDPSDAQLSYDTVISSDPSVIEVRNNEELYAAGKGDATITVKYPGGDASSDFHVGRYADGIERQSYDNVKVKIGETKELEYTLLPNDGTVFDDEISWSLDWGDTGSFELDAEKGTIKALAKGSVSVRATIHNGISVNYYVISYAEPQSLTFSQSEYDINSGNNPYIWSYISTNPAEAYDCPVTVTSSDSSVIEISGQNLITTGKGSATITVTAENGAQASAVFNVHRYASWIEKASEDTVMLKAGQSKKLEYRLMPQISGEYEDVVVWSLDDASDPSSFRLDEQTGEIYALGDGWATVRATIHNGTDTIYSVRTYKDPASLSFTKDHYYLRSYSSSNSIWAYLDYAPESYGCPLEITSDNSDAVTVQGTALILGMSGTANVTFKSENGLTGTARFTVGSYATGISGMYGETIIQYGSSRPLGYSLEPGDSGTDFSDEHITWSVESGSDVVSVDQDGVVTTVGYGKAVVRATTMGGFYADYEIVVPAQPDKISFKSAESVIRLQNSVNILELITTEPESAKYGKFTVTSSNPSAIEANGTSLFAISQGTSTITVTASNGKSASAVFKSGYYATDIVVQYYFDDTVTMMVGAGKQLSYQLLPYNDGQPFTDEEITWKVNWADNNCVTVDQNGYVTATATGNASISATIKNGEYLNYCITVKEPFKELYFKKTDYYLPVGTNWHITDQIVCDPYDPETVGLTFTVDNPSVMSESGQIITGQMKGTAVLTATAPNGVSTSAVFHVGYYANGIEKKDYNSIYLKKNTQTQLEYVLNVFNGNSSDEIVTWTVEYDSPQGCISVDQNGNVTGLKPGYATVRAETLNGYNVDYSISVLDDPKTLEVLEDTWYLALDSSFDAWLNLAVYPWEAYNSPLKLTSSDPSVVEVNSDNKLSTKSAGTATVTVETENGLTASYKVITGNYAGWVYSEKSVICLPLGGSEQLNISFFSNNGNTSDDQVTWTVTSDPDRCIKLSETGYVEAVGYGAAKVAASAKNGSKTYYTIYVIQYPERLSFNKRQYTVTPDKDIKLTVKADSANCERVEYIWTSSNESKVRIYGSGDTVYANFVAEGSSVIKAVSPYDSKVYAECTVTAANSDPITGITAGSSYTGYKGYGFNIPLTFQPAGSFSPCDVTLSNDKIQYILINDQGVLELYCKETGKTEVTVTAKDSGASAKFEIETVEGIPELNNSVTVYPYSGEYNENLGVKNPGEVTLLTGSKYTLKISEKIFDGQYFIYRPDVNKMFNDFGATGLFVVTGAGSGDDVDGFGISGTLIPVKAGTAEVQLIDGRTVKFIVADHKVEDNEVSVDESVDKDVADSLTSAIKDNDDAFGINDALINAVTDVSIPLDASVAADESLVVKTYLDVEVNECKADETGTATLSMNIEPMYQLTAVKSNGASSEPRPLSEAQTLEIRQPVTVTVPVGNAFAGKNVQTVLVHHKKSDGAEYTYVGVYDSVKQTVTFDNPNGFSEFEIAVSEDVFAEPQYEWTETENGYEVTATAQSTTSERTIQETAQAIKTVDHEAACEQGGVKIYEASFRNQMFTRQVKEIRTEAAGHSYVLSRWQWNDDLTEAYAVFRCTVCDHEESVKAEVAVNESSSVATVVFMDTEYTDTHSAGPAPVLEITVTPDALDLKIAETYQLSAMVTGADEETGITWKSLEPGIVSVGADGRVTAKAAGTAVIRAMVAGREDIFAECTVTVEDDHVLRNIAFRHSCSFGNNLSINYYAPIDALEGYENIRMEVRKQVYGKDGSVSWETTELNQYTSSTQSGVKYYRFVYTGIAAKEMGSEVRMVLKCEKNGQTYTTEDDVYGIGIYAYNRLSASTDAVFKTLIVDMLNYGAEAQKYFGYNTANLVNADLTEEQKALGTQENPELKSVEKDIETAGATATFYGKSAVFNANVEMKYYMQFAEGQSLDNVKLVLTYTAIDGKAYTEEITASNFGYDKSKKAYTAKLVSIAAKDVGCIVTAKVYDGSKLISNTLEYSLETYAYNRLLKSTDEVFKAFLRAFMKYGFSAETYFRKQNNL